MRWLIQLLKLCVLTVLPKMLFGQYTVNNAVNAVDGVPNVLLGGGVTYSNLIFSGNNAQIGGFSCTGNCNLGISSGLVIGTGNVSGSDGPNNNAGFSMGPPAGIDNTYDADLDLLTASDLNNVARLEFDFVPTGDSVTFNFAFGSEEYPEYSNDPQYNDVFGFFISGPGISGPYQNAAINIALLPNGLPITINNVNPFNNSQYYNTNNGNAIQADGFTDVLTALTEVECGETYHIKIVIADAFDDLWDSWVFLEANSFESNQVTLDYVTPTIPAAGNGILEGCSSAELNFSRTGNINQSYSIQHVLAGTATLGSDYVLNPSSWTFLPGQANLSIEVIALADGIAEGNEQIMLSYLANGCVGSEVDQIIVISDLLPISVPDFDVVIPCNAQAVLTPAPTGGAGLYNFSWPDGSQQNSFTVLNPTDNQNINLVVSDTCGVESIAVVANIAFTQQSNLELDVNNSGAPLCGESISLLAIGLGGLPPYDFSWSSGANFLSSLPSLELQLFNDSSVSLIVTDECGTQLSFD
ncbi:MAG: choice-of-anchor L domain-containing protein, partial [Flavobacteriales bacterium]